MLRFHHLTDSMTFKMKLKVVLVLVLYSQRGAIDRSKFLKSGLFTGYFCTFQGHSKMTYDGHLSECVIYNIYASFQEDVIQYVLSTATGTKTDKFFAC